MQGVKQPGITCMPGVAREHDDGDDDDDDNHHHNMIILKLVMVILKLESKEK